MMSIKADGSIHSCTYPFLMSSPFCLGIVLPTTLGEKHETTMMCLFENSFPFKIQIRHHIRHMSLSMVISLNKTHFQLH